MKLAILAESGPDARAMYEIVNGILGFRTTPIETGFQTSGWDSVKDTLPSVIRALHFRSEADGLIVLADTDKTSLQPGATDSRREVLSAIADRTLNFLSPRHGRTKLRVAIAVAAPAIEAWLLCARQDRLSEAAWEEGIANDREPYTKRELKTSLHGVERPDSTSRLTNMISAAQEACCHIDKLRRHFPNGFGSFYEDILSWRSFL